MGRIKYSFARFVIATGIALALAGCGSSTKGAEPLATSRPTTSVKRVPTSTTTKPKVKAKVAPTTARVTVPPTAPPTPAPTPPPTPAPTQPPPPPPPPPTQAAQSCTPGYDPCLPPASDYDCEGGSGNGPAYTGYVTVSGPDIYDLDRDGNGAGCE
jgi:hypothetical protein